MFPQCTSDVVRPVVDQFWSDPLNRLGQIQQEMLRDAMLMGEQAIEVMTGPTTGLVRVSLIDPSRIKQITLDHGNPLWHGSMSLSDDGPALRIVAPDDVTGLRTGDVHFWAGWRALLTDTRGTPFLSPVLDHLDSFDQTLQNLIDRTTLARYLVWDVSIKGGTTDTIKKFLADRKGSHIPQSGTVEVHGDDVTWTPKTAMSGAFEDTETLHSILKVIAAGTGLTATWLADANNANRATSMTMAEPVRRRIGGVQNMWLHHMTELVRFAVDQAVAAGRIPAMVESTTASTESVQVRAADTVHCIGPEIAAADTQITAATMVNVATGLATAVQSGTMTVQAGGVAMAKVWEQLVGSSMPRDFQVPDDLADTSSDDVADVIAESTRLRAV